MGQAKGGIMQVTDDERREVARRLREIRPCKSGYIEWWKIAQALGLKELGGWFGWEKFEPDNANHLADLIDPPAAAHECVPGECPLNVRHDNDRIDQERLLAIATTMAADSVRSAKQGSSVSPAYILHAARNIAEACGETFGSIRNQELAKWGTSIVPKETIVDRDALLALADEMDGIYRAPDAARWYAKRIREACGEVGR